MTRQKKTRTAGPLAPAQKPRVKKSVREDLSNKRKKKHKGLAPGSRNSQEQTSGGTQQQQQHNDPRHGSKKPISLTPVAKKTPTTELKPQVVLKKVKPLAMDPEQELLEIEGDSRLLALLEQVDNDEILTGKDAKYFNAKTARHQELMELLGYEDDDDFDEEDDDQRSLVDQWEDEE